MSVIAIRGARTHNLRDIDLDLPRHRLVVLTGPSGSGKSSLAFDTLYAEGQRRYVESLSTYARQFLSLMAKPEVERIEGLSPAIAIEQRASAHNPRSTVGTVTEIHDYLRLLYARAGTPYCPEHGVALAARTVSQMVDELLAEPGEARWMLLAPLPAAALADPAKTLRGLRGQGFLRVRLDGEVQELDDLTELPGTPPGPELVVDRLRLRPDQAVRLADSLEVALRLGEGRVLAVNLDAGSELAFSSRHACPVCGYSVGPLEPKLFSFNNPLGACPSCDGLGVEQYVDPARVVAHPERSLAEGAIRGWDRRSLYYFQLLRSLGRHYRFDVETTFEALPETVQRVILWGSGDEIIDFEYLDASGGTRVQSHPFEGVVPNLSRRYRETESALVREELARFRASRVCPECQGSRLNASARHVRVADTTLPDLTALTVGEAADWFAGLALTGHEAAVATRVVRDIQQRLGFLRDVGLEYLSLARGAGTLSGGEFQRIRLASQIGAGLVGVMYVLDEPSIGLHQRDNDRLLASLCRLRDLGNSVIVVEHDEDTIRQADHVVDMGPGAGEHGGRVVAEGTPAAIAAHPDSLTGQYLSGRRRIPIPARRRPPDATRMLWLRGIRQHNLRALDVDLPLGLLVCVTGVSGSGKSSLVSDSLYPLVARGLRQGAPPLPAAGAVEGLSWLDKVVDIDQSPIGRTPRSNPATYTGLFTPIRELFAATPEARSRGYGAGRFSFNVRGGRCEACQGDGLVRVEMHFLPDVFVPCEVCQGRRYNRETLEIRYRGHSIHEVLAFTVAQAADFFRAIPAVLRRLETLQAVGLGYLRLGQTATTLSGGEAQRVKLARELSRRDTGQTLYILDEPTTGLHFHDVAQLLAILQRLCEHGNTVVVIEHNLEVVKTADWVIDLGPEAGEAGGQLVVAGTPEAVARCKESHTGRYLARLLERDGGGRGAAAES